ncbi:MAG: putative zinc-binding metallopeptidase [Chloroflexi bacterium]|nr:putative zinc-binding metallopeptidase [Chloroflexota bacterium]MCL5275556.1 putative zinc-binding metallopeptidase [Chloroflexota bacterium]
MRRSRELLFQIDTRKLELLQTPINRLDLKIKGSVFEQAIPTVQDDLARVGIRRLEPVFYISTGYGCIAGSPIISFGFYDCDPLLKDLNEEFRGWRYSDPDIVNLLRHEVGHAFCYAYKLYRTPEFRQLFEVQGNFFNTYPETDKYDYNPWSRNYVNPSGDHYAQKHPDEDFAETFQVWLTPRSGWRRKYKARPIALRKLEYVDDIVKQLGRETPLVETKLSWMYERVEDIKMTVAQFMRAKPSRYYHHATGYVDTDLKSMFRSEPRIASRRALFRDYQRAELFLREQKLSLISRISYWVGVDTTVVYDLMDKCIHRARALDLWLEREQYDRKLVELTSYITALSVNYRESGLYILK